VSYSFNIGEWLPRFPLDNHPDMQYERFSGRFASSPPSICYNEQLRIELSDCFDWNVAVPMDVFILARGEPPDRAVTKIGGVPYRPEKKEWPIRSDGCPLTFLAQFSFSDSHDITGPLPGDILLVFADFQGTWPAEITFEWYSVGITDLISAQSVPTPAIRFEPLYGYRYRTVSYPEATRKSKFDLKYLKCRGLDVWSDCFIPQFQATQIGSAPFFIQGKPEIPGNPLCTISSVAPEWTCPYPFVNQSQPLWPDGWESPISSRPEYDFLEMADTGCVYVFQDTRGNLHWDFQSY